MYNVKAETLIIDTNLLVLFVVGSASRDYIEKHKRLSEFAVADFDELVKLVRSADAVFVTPNTLTETSNLIGYIADPAKTHIYQVFRGLVNEAAERYVPSAAASRQSEFVRLGLADTVVLESLTNEAVVLTTDFDLYSAALQRGRQAVNFNHLRDAYL